MAHAGHITGSISIVDIVGEEPSPRRAEVALFLAVPVVLLGGLFVIVTDEDPPMQFSSTESVFN